MKRLIQVVAFSMFIGLFLFSATDANAQRRNTRIYRDGNRVIYTQRNGNRSYRRWYKSNNGRRYRRGYYRNQNRSYRIRRVYRNGRVYYVRYYY